MKKSLLFSLTILVLSCNETKKSNQTENSKITSESLNWLIGNWKRVNEEAGKETFENWEKISSNEYIGIGFTLEKGDTISQEKMNLIESNGQWHLFVKMPNDSAATAFKVTDQKINEFVCENDSIDFPKKIQYSFDGKKINAKISNEKMEIPFEFERIK